MAAFQVAVCGSAEATEADGRSPTQPGRLLAERGAAVVCGGGDGVMAAVAAGAAVRGRAVVGRAARAVAEGATPDLTSSSSTNMGEARNAVIVWSADAVIVVVDRGAR